MAARRQRRPDDFEAKAVTAGIRAFDLGVKESACPYHDDRAEHWHLGWSERRRAIERWDSYPDQAEEMIAKAAPYIDADAEPGRLPPSKVLLLGFYSIGSQNPDDGFAYIQRNLDILRRQYARRRA